MQNCNPIDHRNRNSNNKTQLFRKLITKIRRMEYITSCGYSMQMVNGFENNRNILDLALIYEQ